MPAPNLDPRTNKPEDHTELGRVLAKVRFHSTGSKHPNRWPLGKLSREDVHVLLTDPLAPKILRSALNELTDADFIALEAIARQRAPELVLPVVLLRAFRHEWDNAEDRCRKQSRQIAKLEHDRKFSGLVRDEIEQLRRTGRFELSALSEAFLDSEG